MADILSSSPVLAADLVPLLIKERTLMLSKRQLVLYQFGDKENLPQGQGKTMQFTRYERLTLPTTPLTEGMTPSAIPLTTSIVQAIIEQWGAVVALTDVAELTVAHPVLRVAQERIAIQHSELIDREIQVVLEGGTNVSFANNRATRGALVAGDVPTSDMLRQIISTLRAQGAPPAEGGTYVGVVDPYVEMDLMKDPTFVQANFYRGDGLYNAEIGKWMGVRWVRSNFLPIIAYMQSSLGTSTGDGNFTQAGSPNDTTPVFHVASDTTTAAPTGTTKFGTVGTLTVEVTRLDPQTGQELTISAAATVPNPAAGFLLRVMAGAGYVAGTYNVYVSLQGSTVPLYQVTLVLPAGLADKTTLALFTASGPQTLVTTTGANASIVTVQGLGAVAPPAPPQVGSAGGPNVHMGFVFGKEAFGVIDLGGFTTTLTPATATDSDPLIQRRKLGWKQLFKTVIKNPNFFTRFEALSAYN